MAASSWERRIATSRARDDCEAGDETEEDVPTSEGGGSSEREEDGSGATGRIGEG